MVLHDSLNIFFLFVSRSPQIYRLGIYLNQRCIMHYKLYDHYASNLDSIPLVAPLRKKITRNINGSTLNTKIELANIKWSKDIQLKCNSQHNLIHRQSSSAKNNHNAKGTLLPQNNHIKSKTKQFNPSSITQNKKRTKHTT